VLRARAPIEFEWAGPAYRFPDDLVGLGARACARTGGTAEVVAVAPGDEALLERHFADWTAELAERQPVFATVLGGSAVSLCASARPMRGAAGLFEACRATEAGIETVAAHRGHGYAAPAVAAWAAEVVRLGGSPLYSTSWANWASRVVARKLGLICFGVDVHVR